MFKGVSIRPGKPIMFAKFKKKIDFFGLPGIQFHQQLVLDFLFYLLFFASLNINSDKNFFCHTKKNLLKKSFTRFIKGRISFENSGSIIFEVLKGQESFRINPFTKTNAWGLFPNTKSIFKRGFNRMLFTVWH